MNSPLKGNTENFDMVLYKYRTFIYTFQEQEKGIFERQNY
jgi:hypothetical protein